MTPRTYRKISDASWELARAAYLSGLSAAVVARRFGVTVSGLRKRAQRDGWTKAAHALAIPRDGADAAGAKAPVVRTIDPRIIARTALAEATQALLDGRPYAARAHAAAGEAMARLCDRIPGFDEVDSLQEGEARQKNLDGMIEAIAWELALKLHRGEPLPPGLVALEARWRAFAEADAPGHVRGEAQP